MNKYLFIKMPDNSEWRVPVQTIADNRTETRGCTEKETEEFFTKLPDEIVDWAVNDMNWSDVSGVAEKTSDPDVDYDNGWVNGEKMLGDE